MKSNKNKDHQEHVQMFDLLQAAVSKIDKLSTSFNEMDKKLDLHIQKTDHRFQNIEALDEQQNAILEKHHQRSDQLKKDNELRERALIARIDALEQPKKWLHTTKQLLLWIAAMMGAISYIVNHIPK